MQTPFKKFRKILTAMLKITYAPCGYVNVLSFSLAYWARRWQGYVFVCVLRIVMTLKIIILAHSPEFTLKICCPLQGRKPFFVLRMLAMPFQVLQCSATSERWHLHSLIN